MTQKNNDSKEMELIKIFSGLNERGQESALIMLRSLEFAQAMMCGGKNREPAGICRGGFQNEG